MASSPSSPAISLLFFFFSSTILLFVNGDSAATARNGSFSIDLIHRDSSRSPFCDPSSTHYDRLRAAFRRSASRADYIKKSIAAATNGMQSHVIPNSGAYLMTLSIGTAPFKVIAIADTGSDLIWTQCLPCYFCYKQDAPKFDPSKSSTYSDTSCDSPLCSDLPLGRLCGSNKECDYLYAYGDGSFASGVLASDTFTFESSDGANPVSLPNIAFGCTHLSQGTFDSHESGLVGLGGGPLSLISQLGSSINGKFSYCLVPFDETKASSVLSFGKVLTGNNVESTPIITRSDRKTFYYLTLEGTSVQGSEAIPRARASKAASENIIIDSGTTLTYLPDDILNDLQASLKSQIKLTPIADPTKQLELCYPADKVTIPDVTFQFTGASWVLKPLNTFLEIADGVVCLAVLSSNGLGVSIFGNVAQQNFEVGYDLVGKKLSFAPADCTKL